jgi:hypothetical protein
MSGFDINQLTISGNLTADPELRHLPAARRCAGSASPTTSAASSTAATGSTIRSSSTSRSGPASASGSPATSPRATRSSSPAACTGANGTARTATSAKRSTSPPTASSPPRAAPARPRRSPPPTTTSRSDSPGPRPARTGRAASASVPTACPARSDTHIWQHIRCESTPANTGTPALRSRLSQFASRRSAVRTRLAPYDGRPAGRAAGGRRRRRKWPPGGGAGRLPTCFRGSRCRTRLATSRNYENQRSATYGVIQISGKRPAKHAEMRSPAGRSRVPLRGSRFSAWILRRRAACVNSAAAGASHTSTLVADRLASSRDGRGPREPRRESVACGQ